MTLMAGNREESWFHEEERLFEGDCSAYSLEYARS